MNYRMQQESGWDGTGAGAQEADPYSPAPRTPSWSSAQPRVFYQIRDLLLQATEIPLSEGAASRALNDYGMFTFRSTGRYPTWSEVRLDPRAVVELQRSALRTDMLPSVFVVETPQGRVWYDNTASKGPLPVARGDRPENIGEFEDMASGNIPSYTPEELEGLIDFAALQPKRTGASRARLRFDPDQLSEFFRERWRQRLREEPAQLGNLVSEFIAKANQSFSGGGAATDADAWISQRMRSEARYATLYGNMDPSESEDEYLDGYLQPVSQFGLRASDANEQVIRGLSSGAAPASFAQSLQTTPEVVGLGQGPFSRRFAQMISRLGPLQKA